MPAHVITPFATCLPINDVQHSPSMYIPLMLPRCVCIIYSTYTQIKKGPMKGQFVEVIKRKIPLDQVRGASLRYPVCF